VTFEHRIDDQGRHRIVITDAGREYIGPLCASYSLASIQYKGATYIAATAAFGGTGIPGLGGGGVLKIQVMPSTTTTAPVRRVKRSRPPQWR